MTNYAVSFTRGAQKELHKLPSPAQKRITAAIAALSVTPRAGNVRPMVGIDSWRLKVGVYRVVYDINDRQVTILIIRVRHRKDVYRGLGS